MYTRFYAIIRRFSPQFDGSVHTELTRSSDLHEAQFRFLASPAKRNVNDTFLRRKDAEKWALEVERRINSGEPTLHEAQPGRKRLGVSPPEQARQPALSRL